MKSLDLGHQLQGNEEATRNNVKKRKKTKTLEETYFRSVRKEIDVREWNWR